MDGKMVFAVLVCLGMPMALFVGTLELASEPRVVHEAVVARAAAPVPTAARVTPVQMRALPDELRTALEAAARDGAASNLPLDATTRTMLLHIAAAPADATSVLLAIGAAVVLIELRSWTEEPWLEAHAEQAHRWVSDKREAVEALLGLA